MTTWYILPEIDQLCLHCPVPRRCNEHHSLCLRRQVLDRRPKRRVGPRKHYIKRIIEYLHRHPGQHRARDIGKATGTPRVYASLSTMRIKGLAIKTGRYNTARWAAPEKDTS